MGRLDDRSVAGISFSAANTLAELRADTPCCADTQLRDRICVMPQPDTIVLLDDNGAILEYVSNVTADIADDARVKVATFTSDVEARAFVERAPTSIRGYIQDLHRDEALPLQNHGIRFLEDTIIPLTPWARTLIFTGYGTYDDARRLFDSANGQIKFLNKTTTRNEEALRDAFLWLIEPRTIAESDRPRVATPADAAAVEILEPAWRDVCGAVSATPALLNQMNPRLFERLVAEIFRSHGCDVELTASTRDGGYDIIAVRLNAPTNLRILAEAKRFAPDRAVGVDIVRALYGVKAINEVSQVVLATTSYISTPARKEFDRVIPWELDFIERDSILDWCRQYGVVKLSGHWGRGA